MRQPFLFFFCCEVIFFKSRQSFDLKGVSEVQFRPIIITIRYTKAYIDTKVLHGSFFLILLTSTHL